MKCIKIFLRSITPIFPIIQTTKKWYLFGLFFAALCRVCCFDFAVGYRRGGHSGGGRAAGGRGSIGVGVLECRLGRLQSGPGISHDLQQGLGGRAFGQFLVRSTTLSTFTSRTDLQKKASTINNKIFSEFYSLFFCIDLKTIGE